MITIYDGIYTIQTQLYPGIVQCVYLWKIDTTINRQYIVVMPDFGFEVGGTQ